MLRLYQAHAGGEAVITATTVTVYHSSEKGRRYLSRRAAISAEVRHIIYRLYPVEQAEFDGVGMTYPGYDIAQDDPDRYSKLHRRIKRLVERSMEKRDVK